MTDKTLDSAVERISKAVDSIENGLDDNNTSNNSIIGKNTGDPVQLCQYIIHLNRVIKLIHAQATKIALVCKPPASVSASYKVAEELVRLVQELVSIVLSMSRNMKFNPADNSLSLSLIQGIEEVACFPWKDIVVGKILEISTGIAQGTLNLLNDANRLCKYTNEEAKAGGDDDRLVVSRRHATGKVWALCDQLGEVIEPIIAAFVKSNNGVQQVADPDKGDPLVSLSSMVSLSNSVASSSVVTWKAMIENASEDLDEWIQDPQSQDQDNSDNDIWGLSDSEEEDKDSSSDEEFDPSTIKHGSASPSQADKNIVASPPTEETLTLSRRCLTLEKSIIKMMEKIIREVLVRNISINQIKISPTQYYQEICELTYLIKILSDKLSEEIDQITSWFIAGEYQQQQQQQPRDIIPIGFKPTLAIAKAIGKISIQLHRLNTSRGYDDKDDTVRWFRIWLLTIEKQFVQ